MIRTYCNHSGGTRQPHNAKGQIMLITKPTIIIRIDHPVWANVCGSMSRQGSHPINTDTIKDAIEGRFPDIQCIVWVSPDTGVTMSRAARKCAGGVTDEQIWEIVNALDVRG